QPAEIQPEPAPVTPKMRPRPKPEPAQPRAQKPRAAPAPAETAPPAAAAAPAGDAPTAGTADGGAGGGDPAAKADFLAGVVALLERNKRYPRRAQSRRQQGQGSISIVMDKTGRVIRAELRSSTGHRLLDKEILATLERAKPLPPIPASLGVDQLRFTVPLRFTLPR
ncbi:MAG: TonB family protein, partial [Pseudomonadota bacterium]